MNIKIANHVIKLTPRLKERIQQRVGLAMGRYADRIGTVAVKFVLVNQKSGRPQQRCRINVTLAKKVIVETHDADVFASVDRAIENATRRIAMAIKQEVASEAAVNKRKPK